jgi:multiple antibiotic resistance protein
MQALAILDSFSTFPEGLLVGFPALFSIIDPLGNAIIFSQMTADRSHAERIAIARRVGFFAVVILLFSLWAGSSALTFFGVTLPALKVGGGLAVAASGWKLLHGEDTSGEGTKTEADDPKTAGADIAFFPITMPLVVGPGAISVSITLGAARPSSGFDTAYLLGVSLAAFLVTAILWILFTYSDLISQMVKRSGSATVRRIVALFVLTIGVQITAFGVQGMLVPFVSAAFHGSPAPPG